MENLELQILLGDSISECEIVTHLPSISSTKLTHISKLETMCPVSSASKGEVITLTGITKMPFVYPQNPIKARLIANWQQELTKHRFACCIGGIELGTNRVTDLFYSQNELTPTDTLYETIEIEIISMQSCLQDIAARLTKTLQQFNCEVIIDAKDCDVRPFSQEFRCQVYLFSSKAKMKAAIRIRGRSLFDVMQIFYIVKWNISNDCKFVTLATQQRKDLFEKFVSCLKQECLVLESMIKCGADNESLKYVLGNSESVNAVAGSNQDSDEYDRTVPEIRIRFQRKRKLSEMLHDRDDLIIDQAAFVRYCKALEESDNIAGLIAQLVEL